VESIGRTAGRSTNTRGNTDKFKKLRVESIGRTAGSGTRGNTGNFNKLRVESRGRTVGSGTAVNMEELKKKGPPVSFGDSVAASYQSNSSNEDPNNPTIGKSNAAANVNANANEDTSSTIPPIINEELKKKGPPPTFGCSVAAASGAQTGITPLWIQVKLRLTPVV